MSDAAEILPQEGQPSAKPEITIDTRIAQYVKLRDRIEEMKERHKQELAPLNNALLMLNSDLLARLHAANVDSATVKGVGTAYINTKKSATIADGEEFKRFVIGTQRFDLIDWRANAPAVAAYIEQDGTVPPGLNYRVVQVAGIRRD